MPNNDIHSSKIDESLFEVQLEAPDTKALQSRILQLTASMPQQASRDELVQTPIEQEKVSLLHKLFDAKFIAPIAMAASVALIAILLIPGTAQQADENRPYLLSNTESATTKSVISISVPAAETLSTTAEALNTTAEALNTTDSITDSPFTVDDDLDFQEAMVFFDEQMFAQL